MLNHRVAALSCSLLLLVSGAGAQEEERGIELDFFGDFRMRMEQDWDSLKGDGTRRDDRLRLRFRLRGGVEVEFDDHWSVLVQVRTGPDLSQQSPHITLYDFDEGPTGPYDFNLDHWYVNYRSGGFEAWAGRNELSLIHQDDLFVFDNITYAGGGASFRHDLGKGALVWSGNYAALPVGMRNFSGTAFLGQVAYDRELESAGFTVAGSLLASAADADNPAGDILLTNNNTRDYSIFNLQLQYRSRALGQPYQVGFDYSHNFEDYGNEPAGSFSEFHKDDVNGYVFEIEWGNNDTAGDWRLGYYYAHLEALSANSSYIQDDWVRWGDANQVRATNLKGSEFRMIYTIRHNMNLFARMFFINAVDLLEPGDTTRETGNRFRFDCNVSF